MGGASKEYIFGVTRKEHERIVFPIWWGGAPPFAVQHLDVDIALSIECVCVCVCVYI